VSIPANIAEGAARETAAEFARFLYIARGSLSELETLTHICVDLALVSDETSSEVNELAGQVGRLIEGLIARNGARGVGEAPPAFLA
jgi:four helix bundle protein